MTFDEQAMGSAGPVTEVELTEQRLKEREQWLSRLDLQDKSGILFELEILLKGLDRFFNISNLPLTNMEKVITINFNTFTTSQTFWFHNDIFFPHIFNIALNSIP